jgi:hypothetical protein
MANANQAKIQKKYFFYHFDFGMTIKSIRIGVVIVNGRFQISLFSQYYAVAVAAGVCLFSTFRVSPRGQ